MFFGSDEPRAKRVLTQKLYSRRDTTTTTTDITLSGRSFINIRNKIGLRTDLCGTPLVTLRGVYAVPLITTL